ncbi:hypothetical protein IU459_01890 [Nocardia amamiensis]|uniref:Minor tail protein n=1 Tax=Nocardia amamiensis TaxID=404578 RepID=A0ABS0CI54_9NOCA|nr:hypothetical protein [Nocardia amamiensis]MBF6296292.1 hypothetical protein [Nocardia amamiensis]
MADITFPAHITMLRETDVDGLPMLNAQVSLTDDVAALPLPPGPAGEPGPRGRPRSTFRKMGAIADAAARPSGLGPEDRGKWWHRLDDNGMDVWTGAEWRHSPAAVGPRGPIAAANSITVTSTVHQENLTVPAIEFTGQGAEQQLEVTVPAGEPGPKGPPGASGAITASPDYDSTTVPGRGSVFAYHRAGRKFRAAPTPLGTGPWSWYQEDFAAEQVAATSRIEAGTFTIPAQPFDWRPVVYGHGYSYSVNNGSQGAELLVRLHHAQGPIVGTGAAASGGWMYLPILPCFRDGSTTKAMSPTSDFAIVPAGQPANLVVSAERTGNGSGDIGFSNTRASLVVFARPIE